jgi:hypothetical protein
MRTSLADLGSLPTAANPPWLSRPLPSNRTVVADTQTNLAAKRFADEVASRLAQFYRLMPPTADPNLASRFLEAQVRSLLAERLAPMRLFPGTLSAPDIDVSETGAPLIEDIVYSPQPGPLLFESGHFCIVNPLACAGVIQIKASVANIAKFQSRLREIALTYFSDRHPRCVMGVIVSDSAPEKKSVVRRSGRKFPAYDFTNSKWCPIFILFSRRNGLYQPHFRAIEALLANTSRLV